MMHEKHFFLSAESEACDGELVAPYELIWDDDEELNIPISDTRTLVSCLNNGGRDVACRVSLSPRRVVSV